MSERSEPVSAFAVYAMKRKQAGIGKNFGKQKRKRAFQKAKTSVNNAAGKVKKLPNNKAGKDGVTVTDSVGAGRNKRSYPKKTESPVTSKKKKLDNQTKTVADVEKRSLTNSPKDKVNLAAKDKPTMIRIKSGKVKKQKPIKAESFALYPFNSLPVNSADAENCIDENPLENSRLMFEWLIHPLKIDDFFKENWETTPVHIKRNRPSYYKFLMSTPLLDKIMRESYIQFTKNIDITSYTNGTRETHNPPGRALPSVVWDYYVNGCSVRMLNPQTYIPKLHGLNATLQEFFGCFVGANSYLTPPDSQGFAPHYDDIEAFILQIEGKKRWRLYKPRNDAEYLTRFSSKNFDQSEIGEPILDTIVNAGDLLYFPRGTIHQGETIDGSHSLHVTLSVYQRNCWGDYLEKLVPEALKTAIETDPEFREGLPLDYLRHTGLVHSMDKSKNRQQFKEKVKELLKRVIDHIDIDKAADLMGKNHVHDFLPPVLSEGEQECSVVKDGEEMVAGGVVQNRVEIEPDTRIRLLRSHCVRLIEEEDTFRIYYSTENSKEYHEYEPQFLEVGIEFLPAVKEIIRRYPAYISVEELPIEGEDNKIQIAKDLWEKCIVVTEHPLCVID